jgi:hypothetical protein
MRRVVAWAGAAWACAALARPAAAQECRVVELDFTPTADLQVVLWIETAEGEYVDTAFITRTTGSWGLGNRPGIMDFKSGPWWPYGRRLSTFPVWAHRHGIEWPAVVFQDGDDDDLSHDLNQSSRERTYCRPIRPEESMWDAVSCASTVWTDKGTLDEGQVSRYPPRADLARDAERDDDAVETYADLNPFDAVSRATPIGEQPFTAVWPIPPTLADGAYVVWMEVSREFDQNEAYDFPAPDVAWGEYGLPYRGQPSVVYKVPFTIADGESSARTLEWVGYGDPDGADGAIRPPDATITAGTPGSGAERILPSTGEDGDYLLQIRTHGVPDDVAPAAAGDPKVEAMTSTTVTASFSAPGDDEMDGTVTGYEVRYLAAGELDEVTWSQAREAPVQIAPDAVGTRHDFTLEGLLPQTRYQVGVRAYDECFNLGPITVIDAITPRAQGGEVDACFVATAAYGSALAAEVATLRGFRDRALRTSVAGELLVEAYYTFGPLGARAIAPSDGLRRAARGLLAPVVAAVRRAAPWTAP